MFTYHFYSKSIEMYFKIKHAVVYYDFSQIEIYNSFYDPENKWGFGQEEYFRV